MTTTRLAYFNNQELPAWVVSDLKDDTGTQYDMSTGWTFTVTLARTTAPATALAIKSTGITATATAVTVAWSTSDWSGLEASVNGTSYVVILQAVRTSDGYSIAYRPASPPTLLLKAAPGTSAVSPSSYPVTVTAASVTVADTGTSGGTTTVQAIINAGLAAYSGLPGITTRSAAVPYGSQTILTIPTYDSSGVVVHPSLVYFQKPWNGYRYWMAFTPYPGLDSNFENPSVVASADGTTWVVPPGGTNPIQAQWPTSGDYNSDPYLMAGTDGYLYLFWRAYLASQSGTQERFYYRRTLDGVTWSSATLIVSNDQTVRRLMSPSFIQEGDGSWRYFAVDIVPSPNTIVTATATTLTGTWTTPTTVSGITVGASQEAWHVDVRKIGSEYVALVDDTVIGTSTVGHLYRAVSTNATTWTTDALPFPTKLTSGGEAERSYKCAIAPAVVMGNVGYEVIWSSISEFSRGFVAMISDYAYQDDPRRMGGAANLVPPYVFCDIVNRADAAVPGTTTSGVAWTTSTGVPGVISRALYATTAVNTRVFAETGIADGEFGLTFKVAPVSGSGFLLFRVVDGSNYWRIGKNVSANVYELQSVITGTATTVATWQGYRSTWQNGDRIKVVCLGDSITCYVNEAQVLSHSSSTFNTATKMGWQTDTTTPRFTNIYAKS